MWRTSFVVSSSDVDTLIESLEASGESVSAFALSDQDRSAPISQWLVEILTPGRPDAGALDGHLARAGIAPVAFETAALPERDWVAASEARLGPVNAGRFRIRGRHVPLPATPEVIDILVEAGRAFGSGHHETTLGCLTAIERVIRACKPTRALDLGTGSGVLAIALARRAHIPVVALDIDPLASDVARENIRINRVADLVRAYVSDGVRETARLGRFDLVVANILAGPLVRLVPAIDRLAKPSSTIILSGIVTRQEAAVLAAYRRARFSLVCRIVAGNWPTIVLARQQ